MSVTKDRLHGRPKGPAACDVGIRWHARRHVVGRAKLVTSVGQRSHRSGHSSRCGSANHGRPIGIVIRGRESPPLCKRGGSTGAKIEREGPCAIDSSGTIPEWTDIALQNDEASRTTARSPSGSFTIHPSSDAPAHELPVGPRRDRYTRNGSRRGPSSLPACLPRSATSCASPRSTWRHCAR